MTIKLIRLFLPILIWIANSLKRPGKRGGQRAFQPLPPKKAGKLRLFGAAIQPGLRLPRPPPPIFLPNSQ
jgi:hypothetical protein